MSDAAVIPKRPTAPTTLDLHELRATWKQYRKQRHAIENEIPTERIVRSRA